MKCKLKDKVRLCIPGNVSETYDGTVSYIEGNIIEVFIPIHPEKVYQFDIETGIDLKGAIYGVYQKY